MQKVCIAHDGAGAPVEFSNVGDIDERNHQQQAKGENNLFVSCDKKGKSDKSEFSKRKDKYQTKANSTETVHSNNDVKAGFHCPNTLLESGSAVEDLDDIDGDARDLKSIADLKRCSLKEKNGRTKHPVNGETNNYYYPDMKDTNMNSNYKLVGTTHPSYLQTSMRSGKIKATCYCSNDFDEQFKPTPIHIFCADSDFGAGGGVNSDDDDDDDYNGDSDFDEGKSKKGKKKTASKGQSKSEKSTKSSSTKSKTKTNTTASGERRLFISWYWSFV